MIIKNISIRYKNDLNENEYEFDNFFNLIYSDKNSFGKTTFLRGILFALGFQIPNVKPIDFSRYEFNVTIDYENGMTKTIKRFDKNVTIGDSIYTYPDDFSKIIADVFQLQNSELVSNLLGTIYIDQEKGWTLLNRGKIIGENGFNIESFLRGLNEKDVSDLKAKLSNTKDEIKKYQMLHNVVEYKNEVKRVENPMLISDFNDDILKELSVIETKIDNLNIKIKEIQNAKNNNSKFADFIDTMGLRVKINNEEYVITKNELVGFKEYSNLATMRINELAFEKNELIKRKKELSECLKTEPLIDTKTVLNHFDDSISKFDISEIQIAKILNDLNKEKDEISEKIKLKTLDNNTYIDKIKKKIEGYWNELKIEIPYSDNYLFTHDLKSLSGATLYKMIVAYKFSYISVLEEKCGYSMPIFIDSPAGREVTRDTVSQVLKILLRDFSKNQIFICSIYKYEDTLSLKKSNIITFDSKRPFDRLSALGI